MLAFRVSISLAADTAVEALQEAIARYGAPEIMNTDKGSQFTATDFIEVLREHGIQISMDGKGCWRDNVFVERLRKSVKYEHVYLHAYETVTEARAQIASYLEFYNHRRPHTSLNRVTPDDVYFASARCRSSSRLEHLRLDRCGLNSAGTSTLGRRTNRL